MRPRQTQGACSAHCAQSSRTTTRRAVRVESSFSAITRTRSEVSISDSFDFLPVLSHVGVVGQHVCLHKAVVALHRKRCPADRFNTATLEGDHSVLLPASVTSSCNARATSCRRTKPRRTPLRSGFPPGSAAGVSVGLAVSVAVGLDVGLSVGVSAYASPAPMPPTRATVPTPATMVLVSSFTRCSLSLALCSRIALDARLLRRRSQTVKRVCSLHYIARSARGGWRSLARCLPHSLRSLVQDSGAPAWLSTAARDTDARRAGAGPSFGHWRRWSGLRTTVLQQPFSFEAARC
jgi:hypothetical protein